MDVDRAPETALNRVCAYFTMFPLRFPHRVLSRHATAGQRVLDPFCGRGTTNYAARLVGLESIGIDASPIAAAIAAAKTVAATPASIMRAYDGILKRVPDAPTPEGEFWRWAYGPRTLDTICRLRRGLLENADSDARVALRAVVLGALHGPNWKRPSHLSNQAPRTFAPKPDYSVAFWKAKDMRPTERDVRSLIQIRAERYFGSELTPAAGQVVHADARGLDFTRYGMFDWVITSPPYYGMRTYIPDQWIRNWFVGGPARTDYSVDGQLTHRSPDVFADDLARVWRAAADASTDGARLVIRFGGINDRRADPLSIIKTSLARTPWRITTIRDAGSATTGRRQAVAFSGPRREPRREYDVWALRT